MAYLLYNKLLVYLISVSKPFFAITSCTVAVTEFMDHVIIDTTPDYLQNAKSLTISKDFVVQGQGLVNWSSRTRTFFEDNKNGYYTIYNV